ncbi:MAG: hypothetical protein RR382_12975 [Tannerellaceae bacterium]
MDYVRHETIGPEEYRWSLVPWVKEEFGKNEASLVDVRKYLDQNALSKTELDRREKEQAMMREFRSMSPDWKDYVLIALRRGSTMRQGPSSVDLEGCQFFEKVTVSDFTTKYVLTDEAKDFFGRNQALIEEYKCDSASY